MASKTNSWTRTACLLLVLAFFVQSLDARPILIQRQNGRNGKNGGNGRNGGNGGNGKNGGKGQTSTATDGSTIVTKTATIKYDTSSPFIMIIPPLLRVYANF